MAQRLYASGLENYLAVLDAERTLHDAAMSRAGADQSNADSFVALVEVLGGGWVRDRQ